MLQASAASLCYYCSCYYYCITVVSANSHCYQPVLLACATTGQWSCYQVLLLSKAASLYYYWSCYQILLLEYSSTLLASAASLYNYWSCNLLLILSYAASYCSQLVLLLIILLVIATHLCCQLVLLACTTIVHAISFRYSPMLLASAASCLYYYWLCYSPTNQPSFPTPPHAHKEQVLFIYIYVVTSVYTAAIPHIMSVNREEGLHGCTVRKMLKIFHTFQ